MVTTFESLPCELIMVIIEFIDNPLSIFLDLNSNINRILFDYQLKLSATIEDHQRIISLPTNLTYLALMHFKRENLQRFQNLKSLTLFIDETIVHKVKLPLSLIYLKIHFNVDISTSLFHPLSTLKRLQTLIITSREKQSEVIFPFDSIELSRNIKILQLNNIPAPISSIYHCEELPDLKYLKLQLTKASEPFHYMSFTFPCLLKHLVIHFQLSFTDLEYVLDSCCQGHLKHLELYSHSDTEQTDYFDTKRWCRLFEQFKNLTKCQIELRQRGTRGVYQYTCRQFAQQLRNITQLKLKWNLQCYSCCPGYLTDTLFMYMSCLSYTLCQSYNFDTQHWTKFNFGKQMLLKL